MSSDRRSRETFAIRGRQGSAVPENFQSLDRDREIPGTLSRMPTPVCNSYLSKICCHKLRNLLSNLDSTLVLSYFSPSNIFTQLEKICTKNKKIKTAPCLFAQEIQLIT